MTGLKILIVGAGISGPALATLLRRSEPRHNITVVERWPMLRDSGQQVDLKGAGIRIVERMGLLGAMKAQCVAETGLEYVDARGNAVGRFGVNPAGETRLALTNEYEIMREDMVKVLVDASLEEDAKARAGGKGGGLVHEFGKTVTELVQEEYGDGRGASVRVTFSNGQQGTFDLVVAADGLGSRTRQLAFGREASNEAFKSIGIHAAYYSIRHVQGAEDNGLAKAYNAPGRRLIVTRTSGRPMTQVMLFSRHDEDGKLGKCYKQPLEDQKEAFTQAFRGAGWETERLLDGMAASEDFYACEVAQVKLDKLHTGRVVLLGDAGYCPSLFTGNGNELCLIGAYVLAGELAQCGTANVDKALERYEQRLSAPVREVQKLIGVGLGFLFPSSIFGLWILRAVVWLVSEIFQMVYHSPPAEKEDKVALGDDLGWDLPPYPELKLSP